MTCLRPARETLAEVRESNQGHPGSQLRLLTTMVHQVFIFLCTMCSKAIGSRPTQEVWVGLFPGQHMQIVRLVPRQVSNGLPQTYALRLAPIVLDNVLYGLLTSAYCGRT